MDIELDTEANRNVNPLIQKEKELEEDEEEERMVYTRKIEYLLSLIGFSVGFGNVWRFPYICMNNGGGAFLIPFFFFLFVCGAPLYFLEVSLGQFSGKSPLVVWSMCRLFKGLGVAMLVVCAVWVWYYNTIIAWTLYYLVHSFFPKIPWATCDNWWNTDNCRVGLGSNSNTTSAGASVNGTYGNGQNTSHIESQTAGKTFSSPAFEFWRYNVIQSSSGIDNLGSIQWHLVITLFGAWLITLFCLIKGVKSLSKVVYVTVLLPYVLLTVLLIRALTLPGAINGIVYYLKPDFSRLLHMQVWLQAAVQVFYSLGPSWGGLITISSYSNFKNNCMRDTIIGTLADGLTCFYSGFVVFAIIGFMAHQAGSSIEEVATAGPGLVFVTYPEGIIQLPFPHLWAVLFFLMMLNIGVDTQFAAFETVSSGLVDAFPQYLGKRKLLTTSCLCLLFFISGLPFTTHAGEYILQVVDWYIGALSTFLLCSLECIVIGWIYGAERFSRDIQLMIGRPVPVIVRICWCIVTPAILLTILMITLSTYSEPSRENYTYPKYAIVFGWMIASGPILMVPLVMIYEFIQTQGTLSERFEKLRQPDSSWGPNDKQERQLYKTFRYGGDTVTNIQLNLRGKR